MPITSKVSTLSVEEFQSIVDECNSFVEVVERLGYSRNSGSMQKKVKNRIEKDNINTSHFYQKKKPMAKYNLKDVLVDNSNYNNISCLKYRIKKEKLIEYKCSICGNKGEWNGLPLTLQLDHINGKNNDHRLENLRFLCPNCHSQTKNFSGKNSGTYIQKELKLIQCVKCNKEIKNQNKTGLCRKCYEEKMSSHKPSREELVDLLKKNSLSQTSKIFNISRTTLKDWVDKYDIDYTNPK